MYENQFTKPTTNPARTHITSPPATQQGRTQREGLAQDDTDRELIAALIIVSNHYIDPSLSYRIIQGDVDLNVGVAILRCPHC